MIDSEVNQREETVIRKQKLQELKTLGVECYPHTFQPTHETDALHADFDQKKVGTSEEAQSGSTPKVTIAGRLVLFRAMGKNAFAHIQDGSGRLQVMFSRDATKVSGYIPEGANALSHIKLIEKKFDLGDILGVTGHLFHTQKGELTIFVTEVTLLSKSLLPLPDKHAGLADKEVRYRKRWLDLIARQDVKKCFTDRSRILQLIRSFFTDHGFMEVETPVLQTIYGGAQAKPFMTELHALHQEMFLRISLEIPLKKLIVGGLDRVFEMGKVFRNEGIDRTHNPEFTMLEAYAAYWDYNDMMRITETLCETIALKIHNTTKVSVYDPETKESVEVDMKAPWIRMTMKESIKTYADLDFDSLSDDEVRKILTEENMDPKELQKASRGLLMARLFEAKVEHKLLQPHHIIDHPIETTPLCKLHRDKSEAANGIIERFESFVCGKELTNAYSELNDPILQRTLLEEQQKMKEAGDEEANPLDEEFLEAISQGMPPCGGLGIGIDRLVMLFTNSHSIRDVLYFPVMKPKDS